MLEHVMNVMVGLLALFAFLDFVVGIFQQHNAERAWLEKNGEIPDGHCLAFRRTSNPLRLGRDGGFCELEKVMP